MKRRSTWLALLAAVGLAFALTSSVFATSGPGVGSVTVSPSQRTFDCDHWYLVWATVLDEHGNPIKNVTVTWSIASSPSGFDSINPSTSKTNVHGVAFAWVKLTCKPGDRVIRATAGGIRGTAVVHVYCPSHQIPHLIGHVTGGAAIGINAESLPNTSTLPTDASTDGPSAPAIPAVIAILVAAAIILRRFALTLR